MPYRIRTCHTFIKFQKKKYFSYFLIIPLAKQQWDEILGRCQSWLLPRIVFWRKESSVFDSIDELIKQELWLASIVFRTQRNEKRFCHLKLRPCVPLTQLVILDFCKLQTLTKVVSSFITCELFIMSFVKNNEFLAILTSFLTKETNFWQN